jgi:hypothetical protein
LIVAAIGGMAVGLWVEARQLSRAHRHEGGDNQ